MGTQLLGETAGVSHTSSPPPWPSPCYWPGGSSSSTCASPTTPTRPSSAPCRQPGKPTTPCSDRRSWPRGVHPRLGRPPRRGSRPDTRRPHLRPPGPASAEFLAWLDAVEAECETISGHTREALRLIGHAEATLAAGSQYASPDWFTWFSRPRLAAFKGNTQLKAGHLPQARETLLGALADPSIAGNRERSVILGDLAAVEAAQHNPEAACAYAEQALDQLGRTWYATGMDRVLEVRKALQPDAELDCVQRPR